MEGRPQGGASTGRRGMVIAGGLAPWLGRQGLVGEPRRVAATAGLEGGGGAGGALPLTRSPEQRNSCDRLVIRKRSRANSGKLEAYEH